ncbi:MAG: alpha/beta hydrolase fold domain-containing protein [Pseudonocardia sp.]|nr:alpha/beta hydrolase fold domain-containing protein [Pseudonocardia sp.]
MLTVVTVVAARPRGKVRLGTTVVRGAQYHGRSGAATISDVDDDDRTVLPLPPAPEAIELRHLRAFAAVAEELNFGRAAARLYLSAPALSRQIRMLERLVGCDLLRRSTHHVELTLAGEALLDRARAVLADVDDAVQRTRAVGGELTERMARLWAPVGEAGLDVAALRRAGEALHGQFTAPPEIAVRAAHADGVSALLLGSDLDRPAEVLYLHGGGYVSGSAFGYRPLVAALAAATGSTVLLPDYRLAPEHPFPAAVDDAVAAYRWLLDEGVAPERVIVAGDSSGAGLALSLLRTLAEHGEPRPGGAALLCPLVDLTGGRVQERATPGDGRPVVTSALLRALGALYLAGHPVDDPAVAPLEADLAGLPPLLVQAGAGDTVVAEARALAERARDHGVDVTLQLFPADTHVFHVFWPFLPEAGQALAAVGDFVRGSVVTDAEVSRPG